MTTERESLPRPSDGELYAVSSAAIAFIESAARAMNAHPIPMGVHSEMVDGITDTIAGYMNEWKAERDAS